MIENKRTINWRNCAFFFTISALAVIGAPIYVYHYGLGAVEISLFLFWTVATGLSITLGYHRLFSHRAFEANPVIKFLIIFFGAGAFQESAYQWSAQHRAHHKYVDTEQDPYNIKQGFWYAHIGWLLFRRHKIDYGNVRDLKRNKWIVHQHEHYVWWAIGSGVVLPTLVGALFGHLLGGFLIGVAVRMTFVHHGTFMINSVCHYFGRPTYDGQTTPRDHWLVALITNGEGYHSFHHRFPSDYRNGVKWYHWDPTKWSIALLARAGLTSNLKRATELQILSARVVAEKECLEHKLARVPAKVQVAATEALKPRYEHIRDLLHVWELRVKEHAAFCKQGLQRSDELRKNAFRRARDARRQFLKVRREHWVRFIEQPPLKLAFGS